MVPGGRDDLFPSGVTATVVTNSLWQARVRSSRPVASSHTLSVLSPEREMTEEVDSAYETDQVLKEGNLALLKPGSEFAA